MCRCNNSGNIQRRAKKAGLLKPGTLISTEITQGQTEKQQQKYLENKKVKKKLREYFKRPATEIAH